VTSAGFARRTAASSWITASIVGGRISGGGVRGGEALETRLNHTHS
jgi:hypothetical protein